MKWTLGRMLALLTLLTLLALGTTLGVPAGAAQGLAQGVAAPGSLRVFPGTAAPGETAWLAGALGLPDQGTVWVGGQAAPYRRDPASGWLAFQVPRTAAGGPQFIGLRGPAQRGPLVLRVLQPESAAQDVVAYLNPAALGTVQQTYVRQLGRLAAGCERTCPEELRAVIRRLAALPVPDFSPLVGPGGAAVRPAPVPPALDLNRMLRPPALQPAAGAPFCSFLAGIFRTAGLPTGQVITLLGLLFGPDMQVDPTGFGHPDQAGAPFQGEAPGVILGKVLGFGGGGGQGVTIHVLDTASGPGSSDPYVRAEEINYYNVPYSGRPYHGSVVGMIARAVAPDATLAYRPVCDRDGRCATLRVAQALCAVAAEARRGGRHVVNLSLGGAYPAVGVLLALRDVAAARVPTAAAYGNRDDCAGLVRGDRCWHYPADWWGGFAVSRGRGAPTLLFSVAGWDIGTLEMAKYNRGVGTPGLSVLPPSVQAPGEFWFTVPVAGSAASMPYFGTSFAAPVVSGLLANWMACRPGVPYLPLITTPGQRPVPPALLAPCP